MFPTNSQSFLIRELVNIVNHDDLFFTIFYNGNIVNELGMLLLCNMRSLFERLYAYMHVRVI